MAYQTVGAHFPTKALLPQQVAAVLFQVETYHAGPCRTCQRSLYPTYLIFHERFDTVANEVVIGKGHRNSQILQQPEPTLVAHWHAALVAYHVGAMRGGRASPYVFRATQYGDFDPRRVAEDGSPLPSILG